MFAKGFDNYACDGEQITCTVDGFTLTATIHRDDDDTPPWEREDGHGPVSAWTSRAKKPGERVLNEDRGSKRYYDIQAATKLARTECWDTPPYNTGTKGQRAARAVEADFQGMRAWCNDDWFYVGIAVVVAKDGIDLTGEFDHALWGIECNHPRSDNGNKYLMDVANEYADEALEAARAKLAELCCKGA